MEGREKEQEAIFNSVTDVPVGLYDDDEFYSQLGARGDS